MENEIQTPTTELLLRAAETLRTHAEAATLGPWESLDGGDRLIAYRPDQADEFDYVVDEPISNEHNAAYIALMHPPVALAFADLLDGVANYIDDTPGASVGPGIAAAARAVLREEG